MIVWYLKKAYTCINIGQLHDGPYVSLIIKPLQVFDKSTLLVEKFKVHNLSGPHRWGISKSKENYVHMILGPMECN